MACLFAVALAAGCSSAETKGQSAGKRAAATSLTLAANQVIIGERIEFAGTDGKPVVPLPGVYRVDAAGQDKLHAFFGKAQKPFVLEAKKRTLALKKEQQGRLKAPRAVFYRKEKSPARALLLFLSDGTVYESPGSLEGERARGVLLDLDETAIGTLFRQSYDFADSAAEPRITITAPAPNEVYWNRQAPLQVRYDSAGISGPVYVHLVHRVTGRSVAFTARGTDLTGLYHLDPGVYDVVVRDRDTGVNDTVRIRVVGRIRSVAAGEFHSLALGPDSDAGPHQDYVWAFGDNLSRQCGVPSADESVSMTASLEVRGVAVAAGDALGRRLYSHSLMIDGFGAVWGWGANAHGQLGLGNLTRRTRPVLLPSPVQRDVVEIACGMAFSLALKRDGSVWAWGQNKDGQCGRGPDWEGKFRKCLSPVRVKQDDGKDLTNVVAIAAGGGVALALKAPVAPETHVTIWRWGAPLDPASGLGSKWHAVERHSDWTKQVKVRAIEIRKGGRTCFAVVEESDGSLRVYGWGHNKLGSLGLWASLVSPSGSEWIESPTVLSVTKHDAPEAHYQAGDLSVSSNPGLSNYILGAGRLHVMMISNHHYAVWSRGRGFPQQMLGALKDPHLDEGIGWLHPFRLIAAVGGGLHSVALGWETGDSVLPRPVLLTWGMNNVGQLGLSDPQPPGIPNTLHFVRE